MEIEVDLGEEELDYEFDEDLDGFQPQEESEVSDGSMDEAVEDSEMHLGASGSSIDEQEKLLKNLALRKLFNQLLDERIKQATQEGEGSKSTLLTSMSPMSNGQSRTGAPKIREGQTNLTIGRRVVNNVVKSPSDTTVYIPALAQREIPRRRLSILENGDDKTQCINEKIDNFVDSIRQEHEQSVQDQSSKKSSEVVVPGQEEAFNKTERAIIEVEKYKASIESPPGNEIYKDFSHERFEKALKLGLQDHTALSDNCPMTDFRAQPVGGVGLAQVSGISDDDFFHLICHVDQNLKEKIERGDFVD